MNMITNLFSVFDPTSSISLISNWTRSIIFIIIISPLFWVIPSNRIIIIKIVLTKIHREFKILLGPTSFEGRTLIFIRIFLFIILNNFIGLFPYIFTNTRHIIFTLTLSSPLWISFILFGWLNYTKYIFAHLVPQRTPAVLMPFIVIIETIRNVIRPGTLAVRLTANIIAGHLLITLLGNQTSTASGIILVSLIFVQILLLTLERAVALIQSYVFAVLSTLYSSEVTSH